jgi:hypothetical protein
MSKRVVKKANRAAEQAVTDALLVIVKLLAPMSFAQRCRIMETIERFYDRDGLYEEEESGG